MARTTFSGPVASDNGFIGAVVGNVTGNVTGDVTGNVTGDVVGDVVGAVRLPVSTTAALPTLTAGDAGTIRAVSDNGAGNNEYCVVLWTGAAWVTAVGAALS